jgi:hypothetical protein
MPPKRQYPAFYEKAVPVVLVMSVIAILALLIISLVVVPGLFAGI